METFVDRFSERRILCGLWHTKCDPRVSAYPMNKALIYLAAATFLIAGCHRESSDSLQRQQQQYDTVQEGQTSTAVTSTIIAPGEVAQPAAAMTGTNADTTSNFTLPQISPASTTQSQPGTIAGTMGYPSNPPKPKPRPTVTKAEPAKTDTATSVAGPPPSTSTTPPTTDTAPPPPPSTDTQPPPTTTTT